MDSNTNQKTCPKCKQTYKNDMFYCPYCGKIQWGGVLIPTLICVIPGLVCFWLLFFVAPGITSNFWQAVVKWLSGLLGAGLLLLGLIIFLSLLNGRKQKSKKPEVEAVRTASDPVTQALANGTLSPETAAFIRGNLNARAGGSTSPSSPIQQPVSENAADKIETFSLLNSMANANYEAVAKYLVTLEKQSDTSEIRLVGWVLDEKGGEDLMKEVLTRAGEMGCNIRFVEREWNGIGTWWG
jgi:hypothetical protein